MPLFDDLNQPQDNKLTEQYQDILKKYSDYLKPASPVDEILQEPITSPPAPSSPPSSPVPPLPPILSDIIDAPSIDVPSSLPPSQPIPEVNQEMAVSRPDSGNFFKIFFYLTLVIFLIVVGLLAYNYLKNSSSKTVDLTPTSIPATPTIGPGCDLNDQKYPVGGSFPAADGCNVCTCGEDLLFTCTETICSVTPSTTSGKNPTPTASSSSTQKIEFKITERDPAGKIVGDESESKLATPPTTISITFSKDADPLTITDKNFYTLEGIDEKVPGEFVYTKATKTAILTFSQPLTNTDARDRITVVVKNIKSTDGQTLKEVMYNIDF